MKQRGFTLIELVVVIVILGILAATALPKFVDMAGDARAGVMRGVEASMRGANTMLYAKAAAQGKLGASENLTIPGVTGTVATAYGYASSGTELAKVMDLNPVADFTVAAGSITHAKAATAANCRVTYTAATSATAPATTSIDVSNCS